jgi:starvation-inducible DNA-binding protein
MTNRDNLEDLLWSAEKECAIRPFHVSFPEAELTELRRRINSTRWPDRETVTHESQGVPLRRLSDRCGQAWRSRRHDAFGLYVKTKSFHWHMTGRQFRDYHLLLDEQAEQIFAMTDDIAERARKIGGTTLRSIGDISRHQRLQDNDNESLTPEGMLADLRTDNRALTQFLRSTHDACEKHNDVATASLIENWIDETDRRAWFLSETLGGS